MESPSHDLNTLFEQLGLDNSDDAIEAFIDLHRPVEDEIALPDATFWTPSQSSFLQQAINDDADWAIVVDVLDSLLRHDGR